MLVHCELMGRCLHSRPVPTLNPDRYGREGDVPGWEAWILSICDSVLTNLPLHCTKGSCESACSHGWAQAILMEPGCQF